MISAFNQIERNILRDFSGIEDLSPSEIHARQENMINFFVLILSQDDITKEVMTDFIHVIHKFFPKTTFNEIISPNHVERFVWEALAFAAIEIPQTGYIIDPFTNKEVKMGSSQYADIIYDIILSARKTPIMSRLVNDRIISKLI
jgi:hypothetical protein